MNRSPTAQGHRRPVASLIMTVLGALALAIAGCGASDKPGRAPQAPAAAAYDKLARVRARGTLLLPSHQPYAPASLAVKGAGRRRATRSAENQLTGPEV